MNQQVNNPFYNILPVEKFPGPLRYQQTVSISSLMRPYPQYGDLWVIDGEPGGNMKYQSLQIKLQKNFSKGYSFLLGYNYHFEKDHRYFNDIAQYDKQYTWIDSPSSRQRLSMAGTWEIPLGKGPALPVRRSTHSGCIGRWLEPEPDDHLALRTIHAIRRHGGDRRPADLQSEPHRLV